MGCLAERRGALGGTAQGFWGALLGGEGFADGSCKADAGGGGDTRLSPPALIPPRATFPKSSGWASRASAAACLQPPNSRPNGVRGVCRCVLEGWGGGGQLPPMDSGHPELILGPLGSLGPRLCRHKGDFVPSSSSAAAAMAAGAGVASSRGVCSQPGGGLCNHPRGSQAFGEICSHPVGLQPLEGVCNFLGGL